MATIRKLPSGKWNVQVRRQGHPSISQSFILEKDARKWARIIESELDRGVFVDRSEAEATTLADALVRYLAEVTPNKKGQLQEAQRIKAWLNRPIAARSLASLKPKDFANHRDVRLAEGLATNTVRLELALISHLFNTSQKEWGINVTNPIESIRMPKGSRARQRRLEGDESLRLLTACRESKSSQLYPLVVLAIETAMRLGELLKLTWDDVDLNRRTVTLQDTKNGRCRSVPLSQAALTVMNQLPKSINDKRVYFSWSPTPGSIKRAWINAVNRAHIKDFHFHDLRHEATSRLFEKGLNQIEVASITGHVNVNMLARYTHLRPECLLMKIS